MDDAYLNDDSESASDKMIYLEESNQKAIKEIYRLQVLVEDKEDEVSDLSKMNAALLDQVEEKNKMLIEQDVRSQSAEIMGYLEEANQSAIKEIDRLQVELSEKKGVLDDVSRLNEVLLAQVEEKNKMLIEQDVRSQSAEIMGYLEEANQSAIKEIDRLQVELSEKKGVLDDVSRLNEALLAQVEEKNKLLTDLENRIHELEEDRDKLLIIQNDASNRQSDWRSEEQQYSEKLKASIAVSDKQIAVLRKVVLASQQFC